MWIQTFKLLRRKENAPLVPPYLRKEILLLIIMTGSHIAYTTKSSTAKYISADSFYAAYLVHKSGTPIPSFMDIHFTDALMHNNLYLFFTLWVTSFAFTDKQSVKQIRQGNG
jgi:hypothetical protein